MQTHQIKIHGWAETITVPVSQLTKHQLYALPRKKVPGENIYVTPTVRYDDKCGNGHNTFAITASLYERVDGGIMREYGGGCCHDEIAKSHPELAPLIKWHLCSSDGPMHYIANTVYHAKEHGPTNAWVYYIGNSASDPLGLGDDSVKERLLGYLKADEAKKAEGVIGYRVVWDERTIKVRNLDYARSSAIWPDATDEQLTLPEDELTKLLVDRLPALLTQFYEAVTNFGFTY